MAVAGAELVGERERDVLAWRPGAEGFGVRDAEAEAGDGRCEEAFGDEGCGGGCLGAGGRRGGAFGGEVADRRVVGRRVAWLAAEGQGSADEKGAGGGYFDDEV